MLVILSRIAHGNVNVHVHHGRTVDVVDAAVEINIPKKKKQKKKTQRILIRIVHIWRLH